MSAAARRAGRAHQLDASRLDDEVHAVLHAQAARALRHYPADAWRSVAPEAALALRTLIWACTVLADAPTPGLSFQNLRYAAASDSHGGAAGALSLAQKLVLLLTGAGAAWVQTRAARAAAARGWHRVERALRVASGALLATRALNALLFARDARYRSLSDRAASANVHYADLDASRAPPLEVLSRAFVWRGVASVALFAVPLAPSLPAFARRLLAGARPPRANGSSSRSACALCGAARPTMAHMALPCACTYCYACISTQREKTPRLSCTRCGAAIRDVRRVSAADLQ